MLPEKLVVGLGNPGRRYADTRHNLGWRVIDELARAWRLEDEKVRCGGLLLAGGAVTRKRAQRPSGNVQLFKPLTYMNESGCAVADLVRECGVDLRDILVVLDDLNLPLGLLRMRAGGSAGGHRGVESVMLHLGTEEFPRLRLGIGPLPAEGPGRDFVLSPFEPEEVPLVERLIEQAARAAECWVKEGLEAAMCRYNGPV
jgi:PTH1 family peptidyl-tRNA hydrolase